MGGVGTSPLCFLGGVGGGGALERGSAGVVGAGVFVNGGFKGDARADPNDGGNLVVDTIGGEASGKVVTRGAIGPKEDIVGTTEQAF